MAEGPTKVTASIGVAGLAALMVLAGPDAKAAVEETPSFSATASADGVRFTRNAPGGPVTDRIIDVAGPTAQTAVSSLGISTAYAALPDPGASINSAPGLGVGLLGQGAGGLPPIPLPAPPSMPLQVTTSLDGAREATFGAGPFALRASSANLTSTADAGGGLLLGAGPACELTSHAAIRVNEDHSVTTEAISRSASFSVNGLTFGAVVSSATATLHPDGHLTQSSSTRIIGADVSGTAVSFDDGKLLIGGVDANAPTDNLLAPFQNGMTLTFQRVEATGETVVAPTFVLTVPFEDPAGKGTYIVSFGGTSVSMVGSAAPSAAVGGSVSPGADVDGTAGTGAIGGIDAGGLQPLLPGTVPTALAPAQVPTVAVGSAPAALQGMFDIDKLYLVFAALSLGVLGVGQLIRLRGASR